MNGTGRRRPITRVEPGLDVRLHRPVLRAAALKLCRDTSEADDLVQDTFERALTHLAHGKDQPRNPRAWLTSILRNAFIDQVRGARPDAPVGDGAAPTPEPLPAWANVTVEEVRRALAHIDPELRDAFCLHYLEGLRYREIAARLAIAENTVASRLYRARRALRRALAPAAEEQPPDGPRIRANP